MSKTLVLGVGNTLLTDEGAGVHAMHYLQSRSTGLLETEFLDAGTLSFTLAADIASTDNLIIFDAAELDSAPGTVRVFENDELDKFLKVSKRSVHEVGFVDLLDISRLQDCLPANRALIGIQPGELGWGEYPGKAVQAAFPLAADVARALVQKWSQQRPARAAQGQEVSLP